MGRRRPSRTGTRGGERIPAIDAPHRARVALSLASGAVEIALGAVVASDAGTTTALAWYATLGALALLTVGVLTASPAPVQCSLAVLGLLLLLRHHDRLVLAPVYGACLLLVGELAQRPTELRRQDRIGAGVFASRLSAIGAAVAAGGCAAAIAALGVTIALPRSVAVTAAGTSCLIAAMAFIVALARRGIGRRLGCERRPSAEQTSDQSGLEQQARPERVAFGVKPCGSRD